MLLVPAFTSNSINFVEQSIELDQNLALLIDAEQIDDPNAETALNNKGMQH